MNRLNQPTRPAVANTVASQPPNLLTVAEAASYLRVCTKTVRSLVARGTLPHSRVGKQIRITQNSLNMYLELGRTSAVVNLPKVHVIPRLSK